MTFVFVRDRLHSLISTEEQFLGSLQPQVLRLAVVVYPGAAGANREGSSAFTIASRTPLVRKNC